MMKFSLFSYSPEYLLEQNVIVVTINYRLSVFGFLSLPDAGIHGNAGLKDQVMIYDNPTILFR